MGICARVDALQRAAVSSERADALGNAAARLVDAAGMGREYKVMGVTGARDTEERHGHSLRVRLSPRTTDPQRRGRSAMPAA